MHIPFHQRIIAAALLLGIGLPMPMIAQEASDPWEQNFIITAYYSPLPGQCCYVRGSLEADRLLNGNGTHGADGTAVFPGMIAAPASYAFGTTVVLPGIGTVKVHDRGGAIQEWEDAHRLDLWVGAGEEGLARALAFGVVRLKGTVYPPGSEQPSVALALADLPAPLEMLRPFMVADAGFLDGTPSYGDENLSVRMLQEQLRDAGYFDHEITGYFGDVTRASFAAFLSDVGLDAETDALSDESAAYLAAAVRVAKASSPVVFLGKESDASDVRTIQRLLRHFGYYRGRTDGLYSSALFNAILNYQRDHALVGGPTAPGAGRIGPLTKGALDHDLWKTRVVRSAKQFLALRRIEKTLSEKQALLSTMLAEGDDGEDVRLIQTFLADHGFFDRALVNGHFGERTASAVQAYQLHRGILDDASQRGAGVVGPMTLKFVVHDQVRSAYARVRAEGWQVL